MLKQDIRGDLIREAAQSAEGGGDFYLPFWTDAKNHVSGTADLEAMTAERIARNEGRERLYTRLLQHFLLWWNERQRTANQPIVAHDSVLRGRITLPDLGTIRVENGLVISIGQNLPLFVYPYFCEDPSLSDDAARLGLWIMTQCLPEIAPERLRLLDMLTGVERSIADIPLQGDEAATLAVAYAALLREKERLRAERER